MQSYYDWVLKVPAAMIMAALVPCLLLVVSTEHSGCKHPQPCYKGLLHLLLGELDCVWACSKAAWQYTSPLQGLALPAATCF